MSSPELVCQRSHHFVSMWGGCVFSQCHKGKKTKKIIIRGKDLNLNIKPVYLFTSMFCEKDFAIS